MAIFKKELNESEMKQLKTDDLDAVNGGYLHWERGMGYELIDDNTGEVVDKYFRNMQTASYFAEKAGVSTIEISDDQLAALQNGAWVQAVPDK